MSEPDSRNVACRIRHPEATSRTTLEALLLFVILYDTLIIVSVMILAYWIYLPEFSWFGDSFQNACRVGTISALAFAAFVHVRGGYTVESLGSVRRQARSVAEGWLFVFFILGWTAFLLKISASFSRGGMSLFFVLGLAALLAFHLSGAKLLRSRLTRRRLSLRRVHVVGVCDEERRDLLCERLGDHGVEVVAFTRIPPEAIGCAEFHGACRRAANAVRETLGRSALAAVYLFLPWRDMRPVDEMRAVLAAVAVPIVLFADPETETLLSAPQVRWGGLRGLEIQRAPLSLWDRALKRALDIAAAAAALLLLSPVMLAAAAAIRLQGDGPVLFRQDRKGFGGRPFSIYKFRTMSVMENGADIRQAERNDSRVTRIGAFLRRTSIDELPQLFNVLRGDMAMVGPRPHAVAQDTFYDRLIASYAFRQRVKPGITGWAQINGFRGETREVERMAGRVAHDLWYIEHWSLWLDIRILARTAILIFSDKNAY